MRRGRWPGVWLAGVLIALAHSTCALAQQSLTWTAGSVGVGWYAMANGLADA